MVHYALVVEWGIECAIRICHRSRACDVKVLLSSWQHVLLEDPDKVIPIPSHVLVCCPCRRNNSNVKVEFQTQAVERLVENLPNIEAITDKVDHLPFASASRISPSDVGNALVTGICQVAHICIDQMKARVACIHFPERKRNL